VYFKPVWCILHKPGVNHNFSKTQVPITKNDRKIAKKIKLFRRKAQTRPRLK